jgi:fibronectin type 3 domain-containing protein
MNAISLPITLSVPGMARPLPGSTPFPTSTALGRTNACKRRSSVIPLRPKTIALPTTGFGGVNAFGQMSEPSEAVRAMGRDRTPPAAPTQVQSEPDPHAVKVLISWEMEDLAGDIAGFAVRRSFDYQGELLPLHPEILPPHTRQFVDEQPNYVGINYYQVVALDTAGNEAYSQVVPGYIEDLKPPQKPTGLEGSIDSLGIVRLSWNPNPDPDIKGYKVFFANTQTEVFNALTNKAQAANRYQDTIAVRTLSHKIHYRLVAVDARGNLSPFSDILTLERPDVIPPAQALFRDYEVVEGAIALHWIPSSSEDAAKMVLYRQKNDGPWESVRSFLPQHSSYLDEDIDPGVIYRYQLEVSDQAQNRARSKVLEVQSRKAQIALEGRLRIQKQEESLQLRWQSPQEPVSRWVLYRGVETGPMVTLSSVPPGEHQFEDRNLKAGLRYRYAVRAVYADGRKSPLSNTVEGILN